MPEVSAVVPSNSTASPFVHLHVHTHYSLLDGACRIPDLVKRAKALGMSSLAISDHGAMFGVIEFFNECKKEGIQPILGMEAYMAPGDRRDKTTSHGESAYHLLLLAQNLDGYRNLLKLSSLAYKEGFYYKPRIDKEILRQYSAGLIATSACLGGEVCSNILKGSKKGAEAAAETYAQIFGPDRFYIEVQKQGLTEQETANGELVNIAKKLGVGLVATNDVHFLNKEDHHAHDVLCCISMGRLISDEKRLKYPTQLYLKSPQEMVADLGQFDQAIENTVRVAQMCKLDLDFSKRYSPVYRVPAEKLNEISDFKSEIADDERYLRHLCREGLKWRYGTTDVGADILKRLDYELSVIAKKNFCSYFLIVWDFCNFARENGIPVGARGSGVGTMVGYLLGLCNVDPITYSLLFERFMDPSRSEMPDIDIDICQDGRQRVIEYVRKKYGHVAQIITFNTLAARAVCKDVGRVLGVPLALTDKITKLIPGTPGMTLDKALKAVPEFSELYTNDAQVKQIVDIAKRLEGLSRNAGCHAAGVIIADQPLDDLVPLYRDKDDNILTQFEGPIAEKCGLLKMDFLGLRTLTTLTRSIELEHQTRALRGPAVTEREVSYDEHGRIDIEKIDLADGNVFALFCRGETRGVFQFESGGMQDLLMKMQPDRIEDLIAANALYRPGPMELIPLYCNRKHGREPMPQVHPIMDAILAETYGIMVYQEQVMQIFNQLGGIELSSAYKLIKAISKKQAETIAKFQPEFIKGTMSKGVSQEKAEEIFDLILKFGGYGFNKSHSTRYAIVAFQTAYMKTYHPVEYMAALLTFEMGSTEKVVEYIEECRRLLQPDGTRGIKVLPPDVNVSDKDFTPLYVANEPKKGKRSAKPTLNGVIRFGLMAVRGVGEKAVEAIIENREKTGAFASLYDFTERIDLRQVTRSTIDALVKCGAFSSISTKRAPLLEILDRAYELGQQTQNDKRSGQMSMFGAPAADAPGTASVMGAALPDVPEISNTELLAFEKEFLGFYITSHPLTDCQRDVDQYTTASTKEARTLPGGTGVTIGGMIARLKKTITKNGRSAGQPMAIITLEDLEGQIDGTIFAESLAEITQRYPDAVKMEQVVFVKGKIDRKRETPSLLVNEVIPLSDAPQRLTTAVKISLKREQHTQMTLEEISPILAAHKGNVALWLQLPANGSYRALIATDKQWSIRPNFELRAALERILGENTVQFGGAGSKRAHRIAQQQLFQQSAPEVEIEAPSDEAMLEPAIAD